MFSTENDKKMQDDNKQLLIDNHKNNSKRIAKNTLFLYGRMLLTIGISLYTSRVVMSVLGTEDYGLYVLVGSIVTMFSFWAMSMQSAANRFLAYQLGKGDKDELRSVFASTFTLHVCLAVLLAVVLEVCGFYSISYVLNIDPLRLQAAKIVFHCSVAVCCLKTIAVPFTAIIIAYERMNVYALICIVEVLVKLVLVLFLACSENTDRLIIYGCFLLITYFVSSFSYFLYSFISFEEAHYLWHYDPVYCKNILSFSGWNLIGTGAWVVRGQGINIIFNLMFSTTLGATLNSAYGIASQVNSLILQFVGNFRTAVNPQIIKSYVQNDQKYLFSLLFESAKYSYYLLFLLAFPVILEADFLLKLWLVDVPEYTAVFCQLVLCNSLFQCIHSSLETIFHASARMKENQILSGSIFLLVIPLSAVALKLGAPPQTVLYIEIVLTAIVAFGIKYLLMHRFFYVDWKTFWNALVKPCIIVTIIAIIFPIILKSVLHSSDWITFFVVEICAGASMICSIYFLGLSREIRATLWKATKHFLVSYIKKDRLKELT